MFQEWPRHAKHVAVLFLQSYRVRTVPLITGCLLSPTGKTTFPPTPLSSCAFIPAAKLSGNSAHGLSELYFLCNRIYLGRKNKIVLGEAAYRVRSERNPN